MSLGEADRIVTFHTPDVGKLRAVARGVRRVKSRMSGHLEPLTHVRLSVARGRNLDVVSEAETITSFRALKEDLNLVSKAIFLTELIDAFSSEESPNPEEFGLLLSVLTMLPETDAPDQLLSYFEARLLVLSGFGPELRSCAECGDELDPGDHLFSAIAGGLLCPRCRVTSRDPMLSVTINAIKVLRFFQQESLVKSLELKLSDGLLAEVERFLSSYVRFILERELKSVEFMNLVHATDAGVVKGGG